MKNRNPFLRSLIFAVAVGSLLVPTLASAAIRPHGGGGHSGGHSGFHGGGRGGHWAGGAIVAGAAMAEATGAMAAITAAFAARSN